MQIQFREKVKKKMAMKRRSTGVESHYLNWFLALFVTAILLASLVPAASAGLWYYRRPITITNNGGALTDYQVEVTLTDLSHMNSDGSDLRFTSETNTKYDYWIDDWNDGGTSKIWVNVPSVPSGSSTMYLWYGNTEASPDSNGAATFSFFDDFENTNNWEKQKFYSFGSDHASFSASNSELVYSSTGDHNRAGPATKTAQLSRGHKFEAKMVTRLDSANLIQLLYLSKGNTYENIPYTASNVYEVWIAEKNAGDERYDGGSGSGDDVISYPYIEYRTTDYVHFGTREKGEVHNENSPWYDTNFKLAFYTCFTGTVEIDWVFVRKYASNEPTTEVGAEEDTGGVDPFPELPTAILFSVGLIVLAGYVLLLGRAKRK